MTQETAIQGPGETEDSREPKTIDVPQIVVIDFDRTIAKVDGQEGTLEYFYDCARQAGVDIDDIKTQYLAQKKAKQSFSPMDYVENKYGPDMINKVCHIMEGQARPGQLYSDVEYLIDGLRSSRVPHFIMTYAEHKKGQIAKIKGTNLDERIDILITDNSNKGEVLGDLVRNNNGRMHVQLSGDQIEYVSDSICLIDDKLPTCKDWNGPAFWLNRDDQDLPDELPHNVTMIRSLDELVVVDGVLEARKT